MTNSGVKTSAANAGAKAERKEKRKAFFRRLFSRKIVIFASIIVVFFIIVAIMAPILAPCDPYEINFMEILSSPSLEHPLGTDNYGRDLLSRIMYGARISLIIGVVAVMIACAVGTLLGMVAAYFGGAVDAFIMRACEAVRAVPQTVFAMALIAVLGNGFWKLALILGVSNIPGYTRTMRAQSLSIKNSDYIVAAKLQGNRPLRLMYRHFLPNCISPIIVQMTQQVGATILAEAGLSFLGIGISIPLASWGCMVSDGKAYLLDSPLFALVPGLCVAVLVIGLNILGDGVRDALDPRLRGEL